MHKIIFFIISLYVGCMLVFCIYSLKFIIDRYFLKKIVEKATNLANKLDKFEEFAYNFKNELDNVDEKDTLKQTQLCLYIIKITPILKEYKDKLEKEMIKITKSLEKKTITTENSFSQVNFFLFIISFGTLKLENKDFD